MQYLTHNDIWHNIQHLKIFFPPTLVSADDKWECQAKSQNKGILIEETTWPPTIKINTFTIHLFLSYTCWM